MVPIVFRILRTSEYAIICVKEWKCWIVEVWKFQSSTSLKVSFGCGSFEKAESSEGFADIVFRSWCCMHSWSVSEETFKKTQNGKIHIVFLVHMIMLHTFHRHSVGNTDIHRFRPSHKILQLLNISSTTRMITRHKSP